MFAKETYINRRNILKKAVNSGLLLFLGNDECGINYEDNTYDFRQDSTFLYFFGLPLPNLSAIINIDDDETIIFGDDVSIDNIVWSGKLPSVSELSAKTGVMKTFPSAELKQYLAKAAAKKQTIHFLPPYRAEHKLKLQFLLNLFPDEQNPSTVFIKAVVNQRLYKSKEEIAEIDKACIISADMHIAAMKAVQVGMKECEIAAIIAETAIANGGRLAFPTIATINGQTLHNHHYGNTVPKDALFLVDAGAETEMGYAGDLSSTIPSGKRFTRRQKDVYDIQVASHLAAVEALRPGVPFSDVYDLSCRVICEGMKSLGLMKGNSFDAVKEGAHAMFFPCGLGHAMGLDVHDMENLGEIWVGYDGKAKSTQFGRKSLRLARPLEEGFVLTIEPGIYFIPELIDLWKSENKFKEFINYDKLFEYRDFGGLRNEEDYLITANGARLLGKKIPLTSDEVEALR
ncbi:MAG: aminopeptidase P family protein [Dysgonamonadaceae bacterium]|jgi:Xaa-Pro aminopeptidase|nr:aminopeptidase P family protein [Dysgonamonadaceae bacterium]